DFRLRRTPVGANLSGQVVVVGAVRSCLGTLLLPIDLVEPSVTRLGTSCLEVQGGDRECRLTTY
ncbi:MAG TPA: hypothetical protein VKP30_26010, partial [Polyangiaceae bacterium]|nr:hypothetical protein [Polyangiaceae bacterium]